MSRRKAEIRAKGMGVRGGMSKSDYDRYSAEFDKKNEAFRNN